MLHVLHPLKVFDLYLKETDGYSQVVSLQLCLNTILR